MRFPIPKFDPRAFNFDPQTLSLINIWTETERADLPWKVDRSKRFPFVKGGRVSPPPLGSEAAMAMWRWRDRGKFRPTTLPVFECMHVVFEIGCVSKVRGSGVWPGLTVGTSWASPGVKQRASLPPRLRCVPPAAARR